MQKHPLLTFHTPTFKPSASRIVGGQKPFKLPTFAQQRQRHKKSLGQIEAMAEQMKIQNTIDGLMPEKVLVMTVAGEVQDLVKALHKVPGFEFLNSSIDSEKLDDSIYAMNKDGEPLPSSHTTYLSMSNHKGLEKLLHYWNNPENIPKGMMPLKHAFQHLIEVKLWDTDERLKNTFVIEDWEVRLREESEEPIPFEIEMWYRDSSRFRIEAEHHIVSLLKKVGGSNLDTFQHEGIRYHGVLGVIPRSAVQQVLADKKSIELMRCDHAMFFRPLGQCNNPSQTDSSFNEPRRVQKKEGNDLDLYGDDEPVIALFDGLPLENHESLSGRIIVNDEDDLEPYYESKYQIHGTSMASLIIHGDIGEVNKEPPLSRKLYVRPIMAPSTIKDFNGFRHERIPETMLPLDVVHRAVIEMFEGSNPAAPHVKIINLSIGDPYRKFDTDMSAWARMIDWLSYKYQVLFVISAGNFVDDVVLKEVSLRAFNNLGDADREYQILKAINEQKPLRRMLSPAEAVNAITVKASHKDNFEGTMISDLIDPLYTDGLGSPLNPITLGKNNSVKPEVMLPGGRQTYVVRTYNSNDAVKLSLANTSRFGPGQCSAHPGQTPGSVSDYHFTCGTSNAAAITTRRLGQLHETLNSMKMSDERNAIKQGDEALLLKALITHGAQFDMEAKGQLEDFFKGPNNSRLFKSDLNQMLGYGTVDESRIHYCVDNQATLLYTNSLVDNSSHEYKFPLPVCLAGSSVFRRLIVTVAWFSPVNPMSLQYSGAKLWITEANQQALKVPNSDFYYPHTRNGTVFHAVYQGSDVSNFIKGDSLTIKVNCRERAGLTGNTIRYGLAVTLDTPRSDLAVYEQVRDSLAEMVKDTPIVDAQ